MPNQMFSLGHLESRASTGIQVQTCFGKCHPRAVRVREKESEARKGAHGCNEMPHCLTVLATASPRLLWDTAHQVAGVFAQHVGLPLKDSQGQACPQQGERVGRSFPSPPSFFLPTGSSLWRADSLYFYIVSLSPQGALGRPETLSCRVTFHPRCTIRSDPTRIRAST